MIGKRSSCCHGEQFDWIFVAQTLPIGFSRNYIQGFWVITCRRAWLFHILLGIVTFSRPFLLGVREMKKYKGGAFVWRVREPQRNLYNGSSIFFLSFDLGYPYILFLARFA